MDFVINEQDVKTLAEKIERRSGSDKSRVIAVAAERSAVAIEGSRKFSVALARIMLPKYDLCACVKIEDEKILWSSNNKNSSPYCREVARILVRLSDAVSDNDNEKKKECQKELARRAIIKDERTSRFCEAHYKKNLSLDLEKDLWKPFRRSISKFSKLTTPEQNENSNVGEIFQGYKRLADFLFDLLAKREDDSLLSYNFFQPFLNIYDLLVMSSVISEQNAWWVKVCQLFRENKLCVIDGIEDQHAEQKMLEKKTCSSEFCLRKSLEEFSRDSSLVTITKSPCLFCEMVFSSCERALELEEKIIEILGTSGKKFASPWRSFRLELEGNEENTQIRDMIITQWNRIAEDNLMNMTSSAESGEESEEGKFWIEQTTVRDWFYQNYANNLEVQQNQEILSLFRINS